jgi:broad specificity phosphatase PhoE
MPAVSRSRTWAIPLTAHGHTQARALAATLAGPASAVMVSRFVRAQQTAAPYCQRFNLDPQVDADLDEFSLIDAALIEGLDGAQRKPFVQAYWADPDLHRRQGRTPTRLRNLWSACGGSRGGWTR